MARLCIFLAIFLVPGHFLVTASFLSWLGIGNSTPIETDSDGNPIGPSFPEESGECSHWGNGALAPFGTSVPMNPLVGLPLPGDMVGSHRGAPVGSIVSVTNMRNGNTIRVRVVPPKTIPVFGRVMDLSPTAFSQLENLSEGVFTCAVKVLQAPRTGTREVDTMHSHTFDSGLKQASSPLPSMTRAVDIRLKNNEALADVEELLRTNANVQTMLSNAFGGGSGWKKPASSPHNMKRIVDIQQANNNNGMEDLLRTNVHVNTHYPPVI